LSAKAYPPTRLRPVLSKNRIGLGRLIAAFFAERRGEFAEVITRRVGLEKMDDPAKRAGDAVDDLIIDWAALATAAEPYIAAVVVAGGQLALEEISEAAFKTFGEGMRVRAAEYATRRAAEMVGMRYEGSILVPNPNAKWRIDEATRDMLRADVEAAIKGGDSAQELARRIEDSHAFSKARAKTIARTEIAKSDSEGALIGWKSTGLVNGKSWLPDSDPCDTCLGYAALGPVPLDHDYGNGVQAAPAHPNCECTMLPEFMEELELQR
jgi:hypothetical protein